MRIIITEEQHKVLVETRLKGYRRFLKDNIFSFLPDYILHDLFRETGDMGFRDIKGKSKQEIIDYFKTGWGRQIWDRWSVFKDSKPEKIVIGIDDIDDDLLKKIFVSISWWGRDCYCIGSANLLSCGSCGNRFDKWLESYDDVIDHKYVFSEMGYNLKPLELQGAIGLVQLNKLEEIELKIREDKKRVIDSL